MIERTKNEKQGPYIIYQDKEGPSTPREIIDMFVKEINTLVGRDGHVSLWIKEMANSLLKRSRKEVSQ
jgi:hypothetical protein